MPTISDHAIVLRITDYSETSQVVWLFTAGHGRLRAIAKGAKRGTKTRAGVGLDLLELGELNFAPARGDAELATLTEWRQRDSFAGLRTALLRLYAGLYAVELTTTFTEDGDPHPGLFVALHELLARLAEGQSAPPLIARFQHALFVETGYAPRLDRCVDCGRPPARGPVHFSSQAGGILCRDCEMTHVEKTPLDGAMAAAEPATGDAFAWFELFDYHARTILGRSLRSAKQLREELSRVLRRRTAPDRGS